MKKWIFLILAVLLIGGGVFGYIWWKTEREKELARVKSAQEALQKYEMEAKEGREAIEKLNQAEERLKKSNPELYKLATQPVKDK